MKNSVYESFQPFDSCKNLIQLAMECGLKTSNGMGVQVISWTEINGWMKVTGEDCIWIAQAIRKISEAYINEYYNATDPSRLCPVAEFIDEDVKRKLVSSQLRSFIDSRK